MRESGPNTEVSFSRCCTNILTFSFLFPAFGCYPYTHVTLLQSSLQYWTLLSPYPYSHVTLLQSLLQYWSLLSPCAYSHITLLQSLLQYLYWLSPSLRPLCILNTSCNSPGGRREVSWTLRKKLAQKRSRAGRWCRARERERESVGLLLLQLFPYGGATNIVFVTLFCIAVGTAIAWCGGRCAMPDGHCLNILMFWRRSAAVLVFRVGACFEVSLLSPFSHSSPSLIGLLASVDVKQQKLTHAAIESPRWYSAVDRTWRTSC